MNLFSFLLAAVVAATLTSVEAGKINHDNVQPFAQPAPVTAAEKAAIKFKPSLQIVKGCHPYPAVKAAGETSGGLTGTGKPDGKCTGSSLGSQVYGRADWYKGKFAILYAWYFPKDQGFWSWIGVGQRHNWVHVIVWLDDPELENPTVLAVSMRGQMTEEARRALDETDFGTDVNVPVIDSVFAYNRVQACRPSKLLPSSQCKF